MRGVVMSVKGRYAVLLTQGGDFKRVKNKNYAVGDKIRISNVPVSRISAAAASVAVFILGGAASYFMPASYVSVDINPSFLMTLNVYDKVIDVSPLNADAQQLLENTSVTGMNVNDTIELLIDESERIGYINETNNELLMSVVPRAKSPKIDGTRDDGISVVIEKAEKDELETAKEMGVSISKVKAIEEYTRIHGGDLTNNADKLADKSAKDIRHENRAAAPPSVKPSDQGKNAVNREPTPKAAPKNQSQSDIGSTKSLDGPQSRNSELSSSKTGELPAREAVPSRVPTTVSPAKPSQDNKYESTAPQRKNEPSSSHEVIDSAEEISQSAALPIAKNTFDIPDTNTQGSDNTDKLTRFDAPQNVDPKDISAGKTNADAPVPENTQQSDVHIGDYPSSPAEQIHVEDNKSGFNHRASSGGSDTPVNNSVPADDKEPANSDNTAPHTDGSASPQVTDNVPSDADYTGKTASSAEVPVKPVESADNTVKQASDKEEPTIRESSHEQRENDGHDMKHEPDIAIGGQADVSAPVNAAPVSNPDNDKSVSSGGVEQGSSHPQGGSLQSAPVPNDSQQTPPSQNSGQHTPQGGSQQSSPPQNGGQPDDRR